MLLRPRPWHLHPQAATSPGANALLLMTTSKKERQPVEGRDRPRPPRGRGLCFSSGAGVDRPALGLRIPLCPSCPVLPSFGGLVPCPPLAWCWSSHPPAWLLAPCPACPTAPPNPDPNPNPNPDPNPDPNPHPPSAPLAVSTPARTFLSPRHPAGRPPPPCLGTYSVLESFLLC